MTIEYLLLDNPSDHEVDDGVVTECDVIRAILSNRGLGTKIKLVRSSTRERFSRSKQATKSVKFVHLAGHGSQDDLGLIGGGIGWEDVAAAIAAFVQPLTNSQQRVLSLSCCYSQAAVTKMADLLNDYFTAIYYFEDDEVAFSQTMVIWSMFYHEKNLRRPEQAIVDRINGFFGQADRGRAAANRDQVRLAFRLTDSGRARRQRQQRRTRSRRRSRTSAT